MANLYMALVHYPVINKNGDLIASAITNLDLHDISRAAKTYGVPSFYVITPLEDQKKLAERIVSHWVNGVGARNNPTRCEALKLIRIKESIDDVIDDIHNNHGDLPGTVVTCARKKSRSVSYRDFYKLLKTGKPYLLVLGTAWGLSEDFIEGADYVLDPITAGTGYNHLSVRSAAAIVLDRLMRSEDKELIPV